jgi:hypothetical protein
MQKAFAVSVVGVAPELRLLHREEPRGRLGAARRRRPEKAW